MGYGPGISTILKIQNNTTGELALWNSENCGDNTVIESGQSHTQQGSYGTAIPVWDDNDLRESFDNHHIVLGTNAGVALIWQHQGGSIFYKVNSFPMNNSDGDTWPGDGNNITITASKSNGSLELSASS